MVTWNGSINLIQYGNNFKMVDIEIDHMQQDYDPWILNFSYNIVIINLMHDSLIW